MNGTYDFWLVILSIGVAIIASYIALDLASRVAASQGSKAATYWLNGGAISMGTGIWSMHFIGMLAFRLPIPMSYDIPVTLLSLLIAGIVSGFALYTVSHDVLSRRRLLSAGLYMGIGIAAMHYTGMAAMQMEPPVSYDPLLFVASILIAIVASIVALWIAFELRSETIVSAFRKKAGSALVMGTAIAGMHYTGMAAANFATNSLCLVNPQNINNVWLASAIGGFTLMFLAATLLISVFDARLADRSAKFAETLRKANVNLVAHSAEVSRTNALLQQEMLEREQTEISLRESEERYRQLVELSPDAIFIQSEGKIVFVNGACTRLLGAATPDEIIGKQVLDIVHPDYHAVVTERIRQLREENRPGATLEQKIIRIDGTTVAVETTAVPFMYKGSPGAQVVMRDITERKRAEQRFKGLLESSPDAMVIVDRSGLIVLANAQSERLFGHAREALHGQPVEMLIPQRFRGQHPGQRKGFFAVPRIRPMGAGLELYGLHCDGHEFPVEISLSPLETEEGTLVSAAIRDISDRKQAEEHLTYLAQHDALTGLPNRVLFRDRLVLAMARATRNRQLLALMFLDLDRFKEINDTLGHTAGDAVLRAVAKVVKESLRDVDTLARLGGDEFTLILEGITHVDQATTMAEKILQIFADPIVIEEREIYITASIGIILYPFGVDDIDALLQGADIAMYRAKDEGRNTYEFYKPEMNVNTAANLDMENLMRRALERQEFTLHYQPKVAVKSGRVTGAEALIRWNSKELGSVSPAKFIPLAEKTGLIVPIGEWVLRTACAQNKVWQEQGFPPLLMSVNLSARQFRQKNLVETVAGALRDTGLEPRYLELEITESMIMRHPEQAIEILQQVHQFGVQLSVDDFGTGYSSLAYLKRFPVQKLKIDQSFMRNLTVNRDDAGIVTAVIAMAKSLGLEVVAEGVETVEQLAFLAKLDCEEYQGYYFSRPIPASEFTRLFLASDYGV